MRSERAGLHIGSGTFAGRRGGFTLIELLVVIAIIALLVTILMPSLQHAQHLAKVASCATNMRTIYLGAATYYSEHNSMLPRAPVPPWSWGWCNTRSGGEWSMPNWAWQDPPDVHPTGWWRLINQGYVQLAAAGCPGMEEPFSGQPEGDVMWGGRVSYGYRYNTWDQDRWANGSCKYVAGALDQPDRGWRPLFTDAANYRVVGSTGQIKTSGDHKWSHLTGGNYAAHNGSVRWLDNRFDPSTGTTMRNSWPTHHYLLMWNRMDTYVPEG